MICKLQADFKKLDNDVKNKNGLKVEAGSLC